MNTFEDFDNTVIENERAMNIEVFSTHYLKRCKKMIDTDRLDDSNSIFQEFIVDGIDPEDGNYKFIFLQDLTDYYHEED